MAEKQKPYATFETYKEFNKHVDDVIKVGKDVGFREGVAVGVSFIYEILNEFDHDTLVNAQYFCSERRRAKWDQEQKNKELNRQKISEKAIEDYIKSIRI